ncbi:uncharacterized protein [Rutidosis leptorrhynchoides]|uniref:uncharacterized protein isoform X2 n=1 Tax=Rutidosis leptorrhynchoides TaxID=125765 RepID=UPI003A9A2F28
MDLDNIECVSSSDGLDDEEEFYNSDLQRCETSNDKRRLKAQLNVICELSLNLQFRVKNRVHECSKDLQCVFIHGHGKLILFYLHYLLKRRYDQIGSITFMSSSGGIKDGVTSKFFQTSLDVVGRLVELNLLCVNREKGMDTKSIEFVLSDKQRK